MPEAYHMLKAYHMLEVYDMLEDYDMLEGTNTNKHSGSTGLTALNCRSLRVSKGG
jgi:hypothetical protein